MQSKFDNVFMKKMKLSLVLTLGFLSMIIGLQAELQFSIADTVSLGGMSFGLITQLNSTHYVSVEDYRISLYQVQNGSVTLIDEELGTDYFVYSFNTPIQDNKLYVLTYLKGVKVYNVTDSGLSYDTDICLSTIPGRDVQNIYMRLFGTTLVVGYYYFPPGSSSYQGAYDVYEISDPDVPELIGRFDLPGNGNSISDIIYVGNQYYIAVTNGDVYATPSLSQLSTLDVLPNLPDDEQIMQCFTRDNNIFLVTHSPFGTSLVKCTQPSVGQLQVEWMTELPFWYCWTIIQFADRVIFTAISESEVEMYVYSPGENNWSYQFARPLNLAALYEYQGAYLGFSLGSVKLYNSELLQTQILCENAVYHMDRLVANRFAIMYDSNDYYTKRIYDLENRCWLNFTTNKQVIVPSRSIQTNQVLFCTGTDCDLLTFDEQGSYTLNSFSFPFEPLSIDCWGNKILATESGTENKIIHVFELQGNILNQIGSTATPVYYASTCFYSENHLVDRGYYNAQMGFRLDFYRICDGSLEIVEQAAIPNNGNHYITADKYTLGVVNSPIYDISDPENPSPQANFELPFTNTTNISFDGQDRYLFGSDSENRYYLAHPDFSLITSFRAVSLQYCGRNHMLASNSNLLIILQHPDPVENIDSTSPEITPPQATLYPNPFRNQLMLIVNLKENADTKVEVYNLKGQKVKEIFSDQAVRGEMNLVWDATDYKGTKVASGIYLIRIKSGKQQKTLKVINLKP